MANGPTCWSTTASPRATISWFLPNLSGRMSSGALFWKRPMQSKRTVLLWGWTRHNLVQKRLSHIRSHLWVPFSSLIKLQLMHASTANTPGRFAQMKPDIAIINTHMHTSTKCVVQSSSSIFFHCRYCFLKCRLEPGYLFDTWCLHKMSVSMLMTSKTWP